METDFEQAELLLEAAVAALGEAAEGLSGAQTRLEDAQHRAELRSTRLARRVTITGDPAHDGLDFDALLSEPATAEAPAAEAVEAAAPPAPPAEVPAVAAASGGEPRRHVFPRGVRLVAGTALGIAGAAVLADAVLTWTWQEPVSALKASKTQDHLDAKLSDIQKTIEASDRKFAASIAKDKLSKQQALELQIAKRNAAAKVAVKLAAGDPLGHLVIPRMGLNKVLVQGTAAEQLDGAVGHYTDTQMPGLAGTIGIAGHRTTHGAPFRHIDRLRTGDPITLKTLYGTYTYKVLGHKIVSPSAAWVLRRGGSRKRLVLTACHPLFSAAKRYVVTAQLVHGPRPKA